MPKPLSSRSKVLIIRLSSLGDIVLCSPVIRCIKLQIGCEVHFLQKEKFKEVQSANPYIDKHFFLEQDSLKDNLKRERYDLVIDLHKNLRTAKIKSWILANNITFHKANIDKFLMVSFNHKRPPLKHLVDRYFDAIKSIGIENDGEGLDFFIGELDSQLNIKASYIAFVIGAAHYTKQVPIDMCKEVIRSSKANMILLGGKAEIEKSKQLEKYDNIIENYVGRLSLHESAKVLEGASVVIAGDTGLMHISAALQKPIVCVWGSTIPAFGMYPYYGKYENKE